MMLYITPIIKPFDLSTQLKDYYTFIIVIDIFINVLNVNRRNITISIEKTIKSKIVRGKLRTHNNKM